MNSAQEPKHLVAWIRQESSKIRHLWRLTDSEVSSLFSGLAYPCNKVTPCRTGRMKCQCSCALSPISRQSPKSVHSDPQMHLVAWIGGMDALSPTRVPGYAVRTYS